MVAEEDKANLGANGPGGAGGGGNGTNANGTTAGSGTNTGGGGGAQHHLAGSGGPGGSGVVIFRSIARAVSTTGSPSEVINGGEFVYTFTGNGSITY